MASSTSSKKSILKRFGDRISCRQVLNLMVILGFMFNYMLRVNVTLALVEMVYDETQNGTLNNTINNIKVTVNVTNIFSMANKRSQNSSPRFNWDKYVTGNILGGFYWGYILTELPGGRLAEVIGARKVFGGGMLLASLITLLTPIACNSGHVLVIVTRAFVGFFLGATFPATPPIAAKWIPPIERSKFTANMMASALGAAVTMPVCGFLIDRFGWESVFYVTGAIGLLWSVAWFFLVYDSPAQHPRISAEERLEIETKIAEGCGNGVKPKHVPWRAILTSMPVWAIVVTHASSVFAYFTVVNQLPMYMKEVLHFNIKNNGFFSSFPYLGKYTMAVTSSYIAFRFQKAKKFSLLTIRKSFTILAVLVPGFFMIIQATLGKDATLSVIIFTCSLFFNGAVTAGYLTNGLDIAPNFSGTIMGMANTASSIGGWTSSYMVAAITYKNHTFEQWSYVFWILVAIYFVGASAFTMFGAADLQPWNSVRSNTKIQEMQPLKQKEAGTIRV